MVQEIGTQRVFDIAPLRYTEYRKELRYREVIEDQKALQIALSSTAEAASKGDGVNSIVRILSLSGPATFSQVDDSDSSALLQLVRAEMSEMRSDFRRAMQLFDITRRQEREITSSINYYVHQLAEAKALLDEAQSQTRFNPQSKELFAKINRSQAILSSLMERNPPDQLKREISEVFAIAETLESELMARRMPRRPQAESDGL